MRLSQRGPRILVIGGTYRALCVLEHLLERGERVVAFVGQEGGSERDFCSEILEICDRTGVPARSGRKLGEEMVRWLEDRIRPELSIAVGLASEIPLAIGGNCRLGLLEVSDRDPSEGAPAIVLRQRGQRVAERELACNDGEPEDSLVEAIDATLGALDAYLDRLEAGQGETRVRVPFSPCADEELADPIEPMVTRPEPGDDTTALEREAASYLGADRVFALASPSEAFRSIWCLLGLDQGDEVLCPGVISSSALKTLRDLDLQPVLVDVDAARDTLDPVRAGDAITSRTRAVLVAHAFGQPANLEALYDLANQHDLELVEDGSSALGARIGESRLGRSPCLATFTLPVAPVPGGQVALVSVPDALADRFDSIVSELRAGDGAAAMARQMLEGWEARLTRRRANASIYSSELVRYDAFQIPATPENALPVYAQYLLRLTRFARTTADDLHKLLNEGGVEARRVVVDLGERDVVRLPNTESVLSQGILLPVESGLHEDQLEHVLEAIYDYAIG